MHSKTVRKFQKLCNQIHNENARDCVPRGFARLLATGGAMRLRDDGSRWREGRDWWREHSSGWPVGWRSPRTTAPAPAVCWMHPIRPPGPNYIYKLGIVHRFSIVPILHWCSMLTTISLGGSLSEMS